MQGNTTALHLASMNGQLGAVKWLVQHGADKAAQDEVSGTQEVQAVCVNGVC